MPKYSQIPAVDGAFARWVAEEDPPGELYPPGLDFASSKRSIEALDSALKVIETVHPTVEHSLVALAVKATKLVPDVFFAQLNVYLSRFGRIGFLEWEWREKGAREVADPSRGARPPGADERATALAPAVRNLLGMSGVEILPAEEVRRVVRVADDPHYDGEYYEITVFEVLFGMGYPERQR